MVISNVWMGHGSALFLELGALSEGQIRRDGSVGSPQGEITVMVDFDWRIEKLRSILGGSHDTKKRCLFISKKLMNATITSAKLTGRLPELELQLSNGFWVVTFSHYAGQPSWVVFFKALGLGWLAVKNGKLHIGNS
ncbi:MAG: hypothetical protein ACAH07_00845 [Methylophilaceae bacterium]|nr:hypothetical protein [Methyloradius sp.]